MKVLKKYVCLLLLPLIFIAGCNNSSNENITVIDPETRVSEDGLSADIIFSQQLQNTNYLLDLENIFGLSSLSLSDENEFISSQIELNAKFDEKSSLQGGAKYTSKKITNLNEEENSDIVFNISVSSVDENLTPFAITGSLSTLYKDEKMFAKLHDFYIFMGEGNDDAKMYSLLSELLIDKRIDLEIDSNPIIQISSNISASEILGYLYTVLETPDIESDEAINFTFSLAYILEFINNRIDLGFTPTNLKLIENNGVQYSKFDDGTIQKEFVGRFSSIDSEFSLSFSASQKGLEMYIYDIKSFDENGNYMDLNDETYFNLKENEKSHYSFELKLSQETETIAEIKGTANMDDKLTFSANFNLAPLDIISGQEISGKIDGNFKKSLIKDETIPDIPTDTLYFTELLGSFY